MEEKDPPSSPQYPHPQPPPMAPIPAMPLPSNTTVVMKMAFSKGSQHMICPRCNADIKTRVKSRANTKTHLLALLLCACGCCCCAPCTYCRDSCLVHKHYCPACKSFLGQSKN